MDYQEFLSKVRDDLEAAIPGAEVSLRKIDKLDGPSYEGLAIRVNGNMVGPVLKMDEYYQSYRNGSGYGHLFDRIKLETMDILDRAPQIGREMIMDYSQIKDKLAVDLISSNFNPDYLKEVPHYDMEDLSAVYRIILEENDDRRMSVLVTNHMMDVYQITPEQLHQQAVENSERKHPFAIRTMDALISDTCGIPAGGGPEETHFYVATTHALQFGASVITYPDFMEKAAEKLNGDFYIIPSSVHEVLLVKDRGVSIGKDLEEMVQDVNRTQVPPHEKLSDRVYHYDSSARVFELAEKYESRETGLEKKFSVRAELDQKGKEVEQKKQETPKTDKDVPHRRPDNQSL